VMGAILEGLQLDPTKLELDQDEEQQLQQAAQKPDPKVEAAMIQSQTQMAIAGLKSDIDKLALQVEAGMKGVELQHGKDVADTQAAANIAQESMKQHGAHTRELVKAVPKIATLGGKPAEKEAPAEKEPSVNEALGILGLG
jgi:alpha-D-ribose 1-methylphosphonate 5-triphosphate diphosphatase PhnM